MVIASQRLNIIRSSELNPELAESFYDQQELRNQVYYHAPIFPKHFMPSNKNIETNQIKR